LIQEDVSRKLGQFLGRNWAKIGYPMDELAQTLPKKTLPDRIHRELRKGETIYHSTLPCHVSKKFPEGKWIAQVRRDDKSGKLIKYPVKGFGTPKEALDHIRTLRPNERGQVSLQGQGEPTVAALYEFVREHRQKRLTESTKAGKESRWRLHIEPEWADWPLSKVTRRAAQEWLTAIESKIADGSAGTLGLAQLEKIRTDLHALFESLSSFSSEYEDRRNPFAELDFIAPPPRTKVTIESQHFAPLHYACFRLVEEQLCSRWIVEVFLTALLSGLRQGEVLALCSDQIDLDAKAITVDRAMRRNSRALDPKTRKEVGSILRQAIHFPKGGTISNPKTRVVPISDQLAKILRVAMETHSTQGNTWNLVWPSETGTLKQLTRFRQGLAVLLERLQEIATLAPIEQVEAWPEIPKRRGWQLNPVVNEARENSDIRLPPLFTDLVFRDTRSSFASYMNEVGLPQATREHILGHANGLTNFTYTEVTTTAFREAQVRLSNGWNLLV